MNKYNLSHDGLHIMIEESGNLIDRIECREKAIFEVLKHEATNLNSINEIKDHYDSIVKSIFL